MLFFCLLDLIRIALCNFSLVRCRNVSSLTVGWFGLGIRDWLRLLPFGVAVGGLSYLSLQVTTPVTSFLFLSPLTSALVDLHFC